MAIFEAKRDKAMKEQKVRLSEIKNNPNNPRLIKDEKFEKLKKSITDFPKMMELRPMVINSDNIVLGGNMRLKALKELGYKEVPGEWVKRAEDLTEEQQRQFIIKDNVGFGEHDWEVLNLEWDAEELSDWGLEIPITSDKINNLTDSEIDEEIEKIDKYNDENCELPIVPVFHEKYSYFIILVENEIDESFIRNRFGLNEKHTSHKLTDDRLSNIIPFKKLQEQCLK